MGERVLTGGSAGAYAPPTRTTQRGCKRAGEHVRTHAHALHDCGRGASRLRRSAATDRHTAPLQSSAGLQAGRPGWPSGGADSLPPCTQGHRCIRVIFCPNVQKSVEKFWRFRKKDYLCTRELKPDKSHGTLVHHHWRQSPHWDA